MQQALARGCTLTSQRDSDFRVSDASSWIAQRTADEALAGSVDTAMTEMCVSDEQQITSDGLTLDLTNAHLPSLLSVPLPASLTDLDLTANRLTTLEPSLLALPDLRAISLRQNLIEDASSVGQLVSAPILTELILQDNRLSTIPDLSALLALQRLEVSYNEIKRLAPLSSLKGANLSALFAASNKIASADGIQHLTQLTQLELGCNRLRSAEPAAGLLNLRELWLGRNRIPAVQHLSRLTELRRLSLQSNRLESTQGLGACTALEELYLSHNGIATLQDLEALVNLTILDVSSNRLQELPPLSHFTRIQDLWLNDNQLGSQQALLDRLAEVAGTLTTLYVANNPASVGQFALRAGLKALSCEQLEQLDDLLWHR